MTELFCMLQEWLLALGGQMPNAGQWVTTTQSVNKLIPLVVRTLTDKHLNTTTKGAALDFLTTLAESHGNTALCYELGSASYVNLIQGILSCSECDGNTIKCQSLRLLEAMLDATVEQSEGSVSLFQDCSVAVLTRCQTLIQDKEIEVTKAAVEVCSRLLMCNPTGGEGV